MNFIYTDNIPDAPNNPSNDQPDMEVNNNSISGIIAIDHFGFNDNFGGWHNVVHLGTQLGDPANSLVGQLYSKVFAGESVLYYKSAGSNTVNKLTQLSSNATNGFILFPGGLIMQWGVLSQSNTQTRSVTFPTPFTTEVYNIQFSTTRSDNTGPGTSYNIFVDVSSITLAGFDLKNRSTHSYGFYWTAIGK